MNKPKVAAAPETGIPTFEDLATDPEIAPLLDFEPVTRKVQRPDGWTPQLQRELIARLADTGTVQRAVWQMGKHATGAEALYKSAGAPESFVAAWDAALVIGRRRNGLDSAPPRVVEVPGITRRSARPGPWSMPLAPGEVYNENGMPEDEGSFRRRGEEARDNIGEKLLRCRRAYLLEISRNPGKRAAFELLTELPIDWDKARRHQPQDHEPWRRANFLEADMVLTAENGWCGSIVPTYGPDKIGKLRDAVNKARKKRGLPMILDWTEDSESAEPSDAGACAAGAGRRDAEPDRPGCDREATDSFDVTDSLRDDATPTGPPPMRSFGLNSQEFYDAVAKPGRRAIIPPRD